MPELAEAEIHRRNLDGWTRGRTLEAVEAMGAGRLSGELEVLFGRRVCGWHRRAKYLIGHLEGGWRLLVHLGMSGNWVADTQEPAKYARFVFRMKGGAGPSSISLVDRRRLGRLWVCSEDDLPLHPRLRSLGPEPMGPEFHAGFLHHRIGSSRVCLQTRLLDQSVGAGVGNIAIIEACFRARLHPQTTCKHVPLAGWWALIFALQDHFDMILRHPSGAPMVYISEGRPEPLFRCYGREGAACTRCGASIQKALVGGRPSFWCEGCQPMLR